MPGKNSELAIVGCGPAGLSAAVNAAARRKDFILFGVDFCSTKLHRSPQVDNYLGFHAVSGQELREKFLGHVDSLGITITRQKIDAIYSAEGGIELFTGEDKYFARAVILATGMAVARAIPGEQDFLGRGVSYCATCDGLLYRQKTVALLGYTPDSEKEARFLGEICKQVYFLPLYPDPPGSLPPLTIISHKPEAIEGDDQVTHLLLNDGTKLEIEAVFVEREAVPPGQLVQGAKLEGPHLAVDRQQQTSIPGIYAAGDCTGLPYQLAKAIGEGQVAALSAVKYLDSRK
ncbi:MAG: NAD(P)/FAD-dependent oxidoreductase [Bacillota bacterium]